MRNSTTTISTISHYKFHQGNHGSSILYLLLAFYVVNAYANTHMSRKGRLGVVGIFFVSFHFFFFPSSIELPRPWKFDQELRMEKRNHPFRDISLTLFFFSYCRVFCTCRVLVNHDSSVKGTLVICQKGPLFGICFELKYRTST